MASILVVAGPNEGDYYPLGNRTVVIGRDEGCPIQIVDELVSRKHMQIRRDPNDGQYHILDMQSANGIYLNSRHLEHDTVLADGDEIDLGNSKLVFSTKRFADRDSAFEHYRKQGQRRKSTLVKDAGPKQAEEKA